MGVFVDRFKMRASIDLFECDLNELEQHVVSSSISMETLEFYVKETLELIERQKAEDKEQDLLSSPRVRSSSRSRRKSSGLESTDNLDTLSIASSVTSKRRSNARKNRKKSPKNNKMDEESEPEQFDDILMSERDQNQNQNENEFEYEWFANIEEADKSSTSSDDALLNLDIKNLEDGDFEDLENLLNDKKNVKSQRERKKKKKKKKNYLKSLEDEELETWDLQKFEVLVGEWSVIRLEKEMKSTEKQIKEIKQRKMNKHNVSESEEDLDALTAD